MFAAVYSSDTQPPPNPKSCARQILVKVHTDRFETASFRVYYAALACTSFITRCTDVLDGQDPTQARAMPPLLITPFTAEAARGNPPSRFEYRAAEAACKRGLQPFAARWGRIATAATAAVKNAEEAFWAESEEAAGVESFFV